MFSIKLKKNTIKFSIIGIFLIIVLIVFYSIYKEMQHVWDNSTTWTSKNVISLPAKYEDLRITYVEKKITDTTVKFDFKSEYCYLYEIERAGDLTNSKIKCSLLPMYYAEREKEVPKDWMELSDVELVVTKDWPEPKEFIDRINKDFESVSELGSFTYPVSISVSGVFKYPEKNILNMYLHWFDYLNNEKTFLETSVEEYSVKKLDDLSNDEISTYIEIWEKQITEFIITDIRDSGVLSLQNQDFLNLVNSYLDPHRYKCSNLGKCKLEYESNIGESYAYLYFWALDKFPEYADLVEDVTYSTLYPFNGMTENEIASKSDDETIEWGYFSPYDFPICPIGHKNEKIDRFMREYLDRDNTDLESTYMNTIEKFLSSDDEINAYESNGAWNPDLVLAISYGCMKEYGLDNSSDSKRAFYKLLSKELNIDNAGSRSNLEDFIYSSTAFSPYKNHFVSDASVQMFREDYLSPSNESAERYEEWRSRINTYIILYLLNNE